MTRLFVEQPRLHRVREISLRRRHAQTVKNGASSHKTNYIDIFQRFKIFAILLNGWILFTGGVTSGGVCPAACAAGLLINDGGVCRAAPGFARVC